MKDCPVNAAKPTEESTPQPPYGVFTHGTFKKTREAYIEQIDEQTCICLLNTGGDVVLFSASLEKG